ncbi:putative N-acetylated-alpha-linked acidic dipeptidase [Homarus americanus]|uniref:putative N-acetylated-alpha-linked acidic dipeptidase n=1 Tax=Homarus americanus TaxID=6706 RepID=UPI001C46469F|nr:putative N-acetylated-alpha-linked acidic dipeptidase [Homarus americanus]XP_042204190.1 putative N-acetylated-alpha-linked acidic dipeptidase [Homarus americanus]XP_042204191.1 putative N-acetylated-alpha-linked acidic dipeptidase [Homarus americanus]
MVARVLQGVGVGALMVAALSLLLALNLNLGSFTPSPASAEISCSSSRRSPLTTVEEDALGRVKPSGDDYFGTAGEELINEMKADNMEKNLRYLTSQGHMAGTKQDLEQAEYLKKLWLEQGLDQVFLQPYTVQLSHPDLSKPNKVYLMDDEGQVKFTSSILEDPLDGVDYDDSIPPAFLAFSPAGTIVTNELVYVNYGLYEDFEAVEAAGIKVKGRLVIAKFGQGFRGDKVQNAERFNASGIIIYTDPSDYHPDLEQGGAAYPNSFWLPESGIQRGSIVWHDGDPTTPLYPALDGMYRVPDEQTDTPRIPAHTLSYNDARKLLVNIGGEEVPPAWRGGLNITYRMGPQLVRPGWTVKLEVHNIKHLVPTYNVIGVIHGSEEPDRYVIYGNHRDSWTFGSCDPSSATAVQMEMVRAYGQLLRNGWRPRRSMVFGSWGAGEYGFFGPWEWVEEYLKVFEMRAVAHLNVDLAIIGTYNMLISATPLLHKIIKEATKRTPAPDPSLGYTTLWEHWSQRLRAASPDLLDYNLASLSEHSPFYQHIGVPTSYMVWEINFEEYNWSDYPLYHTTYEDFDAVKNILDPEFRYHLAIGRLWALMGIGLADAKILPMDPDDETVMLRKMVADLKAEYGDTLQEKGISLAHLDTVVNRFDEVAKTFITHVNNLTDVPLLLARQLNDQLLLLEKCYTNEAGSYLRPHVKNLMFGTSNFNQYEGWLAPGVRDALWEATHCQESCDHHWQVVQHQLSLLQYVINSAVLTMKDIRYI